MLKAMTLMAHAMKVERLILKDEEPINTNIIRSSSFRPLH